uniref:Riparin-1.5 amide n=1 Tax=Crinia riparia TaxID=446489 RepID=RI15A_CRIRI|nr:RecName: Full=Riparin-1.5 amide; Flags: Precursor [Crinia riparia]ABQ88315.1 riparin 1.5 amide precursor [Crinia riparia]
MKIIVVLAVLMLVSAQVCLVSAAEMGHSSDNELSSRDLVKRFFLPPCAHKGTCGKRSIESSEGANGGE